MCEKSMSELRFLFLSVSDYTRAEWLLHNEELIMMFSIRDFRIIQSMECQLSTLQSYSYHNTMTIEQTIERVVSSNPLLPVEHISYGNTHSTA